MDLKMSVVGAVTVEVTDLNVTYVLLEFVRSTV